MLLKDISTLPQLLCPASGHPVPTITWNLNGHALSKNDSDITSQSTMLTIENVDAQNGGKYVCTAENEAGIARGRQVVAEAGKMSSLLIQVIKVIVI